MPAIADIINYAKVSQERAACDINNQKYLKGGAIDERLPVLLYTVRKSVEWLYNKNPADDTLTATANYLYALCGQYGLEAQYVDGNVAGSIIPTTPIQNQIYSTVKIIRTVPFTYPTINLGNPVAEGTMALEIRDAGIDEDSFLLFINSQKIDENLTDQFSFTHTYENNIFTIIFNQQLYNTNRLEIRYGKTTPA